VAAGLANAGYDSFYRYQLGLPVWRALGNTVQTDFEGFAYIFSRDGTAVFVDARPPQDFLADSVACAVNIQPSEATAANDDGRLPLWDKGARVVVFADDPHLAKKVASEIAKKAIGAAAISAGPSRIWKAAASGSTAGAAATTTCIVAKLMMNRPRLCLRVRVSCNCPRCRAGAGFDSHTTECNWPVK